MGLDLDKIRKRQADDRARRGGRFKLADGKNRIRILKFKHKVTKEDVAAKLYEKGELGTVVEEIDRPISIHWTGKNNSPVLSTPKLVAEYEKYAQSGKAKDLAYANKIGPRSVSLVNLVDTNERPYRVRQTMLPKSVIDDVWAKVLDEDYGEGVLGVRGRDFTVVKNPKAKAPKDYYKTDVRDKDACAALPAKLEKDVADLYRQDVLVKVGLVPKDGGDDSGEEE